MVSTKQQDERTRQIIGLIQRQGKTLLLPEITIEQLIANALGSSGVLRSGTYTPVRSNEVNLDASVTPTVAQWLRVGNTVTVSGRFTANPTTTATFTAFALTLPVASNLGAEEDLAGVAFTGSNISEGAEIVGVVATDKARVQWIATNVAEQTWSYTFTYRVI